MNYAVTWNSHARVLSSGGTRDLYINIWSISCRVSSEVISPSQLSVWQQKWPSPSFVLYLNFSIVKILDCHTGFFSWIFSILKYSLTHRINYICIIRYFRNGSQSNVQKSFKKPSCEMYVFCLPTVTSILPCAWRVFDCFGRLEGHLSVVYTSAADFFAQYVSTKSGKFLRVPC